MPSVRTIKQLGLMLVNGILAFFNLGTGEVILIVAIILLLFGGRKIPELMRGLGKGVKSFKQGMNEVEDELKKPIVDLDKDKNQKLRITRIKLIIKYNKIIGEIRSFMIRWPRKNCRKCRFGIMSMPCARY